MMKNVKEMKKEVLVSINGTLSNISLNDYNEILDNFIFLSQIDFITKYRIKYPMAIQDLHLVTTYRYKTFDGGEIEVELHKFDGDYDFKYNMEKYSQQAQKIQDDFEASWVNDNLAVQLF